MTRIVILRPTGECFLPLVEDSAVLQCGSIEGDIVFGDFALGVREDIGSQSDIFEIGNKLK